MSDSGVEGREGGYCWEEEEEDILWRGSWVVLVRGPKTFEYSSSVENIGH